MGDFYGGKSGGMWSRFANSYLTRFGYSPEEFNEMIRKVENPDGTTSFFGADGALINPESIGSNYKLYGDPVSLKIGEAEMADQTEQMNRLLDPNSAVREGEMNYSYQVDDGIEQMTPSQMGAARASGEIVRDPGSAVREVEMAQMLDPGSAVRESELQMINNAQMGLMEMDPEGTKDVVQGLEMTKQKVMSGEGLTEGESSGIMAILQKLGGALSGMMSGGETKSYMVDGKIVEMTEREMMGAKNAGILVQDVESGIRDMEMNQ